MEQRHIAFILPNFLAGGAERALIRLMNGLDRTRFAPSLICVTARGRLRSTVDADIPVYILSRNASIPLALPLLWWRLRRLKPDIAMSTLAAMNFGLLLLKPFLPRLRFIVRETILPSHILARRRDRLLVRGLYRFLYPRANSVVAPAQLMLDDLEMVMGRALSNLQLLPNAVDADALRHGALPLRDPAARIFVAAGRLHPNKGFDRLIGALKNWQPGFAWNLVIIGEGDAYAALAAQVQQWNLHDRVSLAGFLPEPWPHYAAADAFLLCSRMEGLPNVVLEALACGTPVIGLSEAGGIGEIAARSPAVTLVDDIEHMIETMGRVTPHPAAAYRPSLLPDFYSQRTVGALFSRLLDGL